MCIIRPPPRIWSLRLFSPIMKDPDYFSSFILLTFLNIFFVRFLYLCATYTANISLLTVKCLRFQWAAIIFCDLNWMHMHSANGCIYCIIKQIAPFLACLHSIPYLQMRLTLDLEIVHRVAILGYDQLSSSRKKVATALYFSEMLPCLTITSRSCRPLQSNYTATRNFL